MTILDEALERLRDTGPERGGWLSNHAPMAAEAMIRHGHGRVVHRWIDAYSLEERPRGIAPIEPDQWREPLGDPVRTGDWIAFFERALREQPWRDVLAVWWPRLLPGIAAGATHGVIRVGHAVRSLLDAEASPSPSAPSPSAPSLSRSSPSSPSLSAPSPSSSGPLLLAPSPVAASLLWPAPRVVELAHGLAYWAARWQPLAPAGSGPYRASDPRAALDAVPRVPDQRFGIRHRLAQLATLPSWPFAAVPGEGEPVDRLRGIVTAAVLRHHTHGYGNAVMLVHAATAPTAVLRTLLALPPGLHEPSVAAAWAATAAVTSAYSPATPQPVTAIDARDPDAVMDHAVESGDAHAIKFADAALDAFGFTGDVRLLAAAENATRMID